MSYPTQWKRTVLHRLEQITRRLQQIDTHLDITPDREGAYTQRETDSTALRPSKPPFFLYASWRFCWSNGSGGVIGVFGGDG